MSRRPVFHEGELAVQARAGVAEAARQTERVIRDRLIPGVEGFIRSQPLVFCASIDRGGNVWASMIQGAPGFVGVTDDHALEVTLDAAGLDAGDPLWANIAGDPRIGLLLIEFHSRRRLRINGDAARPSPERLTVAVHASYPNCPKYIQGRQPSGTWVATAPVAERAGALLDEELVSALTRAGTLFVASAHPEGGADMSHRGGRPGFVHVLDAATLRIPDYAGNNLFNTLGNFQSYPRAGLLLADFRTGRTFQIIGRPEIEWNARHPGQATGGTQRYWRLHVEQWRAASLPKRMDWAFLDYSPHLPPESDPR